MLWKPRIVNTNYYYKSEYKFTPIREYPEAYNVFGFGWGVRIDPVRQPNDNDKINFVYENLETSLFKKQNK
jgi:hypothetical protein